MLTSEYNDEKLVFALLESLRYIFRVPIIKNEKTFEGYQLNSGVGRNFVAEGT